MHSLKAAIPDPEHRSAALMTWRRLFAGWRVEQLLPSCERNRSVEVFAPLLAHYVLGIREDEACMTDKLAASSSQRTSLGLTCCAMWKLGAARKAAVAFHSRESR